MRVGGCPAVVSSIQGSTTALNEALLNGHVETVTMLVKANSESIKKI